MPSRRSHPYGRSADDVRRSRLRRGRTRRLRITQLVVFSVLAIVLIGIGAYAIGELRSPATDPGQIAEKTFGAVAPEVTCPEPGAVPAAPEDVTVTVLNGTGTSGLAGRTTEELAERGYGTGDAGNTRNASGAAVIVHGPEGYLAAQSVLAQVGEGQLRLDGREGTEVDLLLGDGYDGLVEPEVAAETLATEVAVPEGC